MSHEEVSSFRLKTTEHLLKTEGFRNSAISLLLAILFVVAASRNGFGSLPVLLPGALPFLLLQTDVHSPIVAGLFEAVAFAINCCLWAFLFYFALFRVPKLLRRERKPR